MYSRCKIPCNMSSSSTKTLQIPWKMRAIPWKMRGSISKCCKHPWNGSFQLQTANRKENGQNRKYFLKNGKKTKQTPEGPGLHCIRLRFTRAVRSLVSQLNFRAIAAIAQANTNSRQTQHVSRIQFDTFWRWNKSARPVMFWAFSVLRSQDKCQTIASMCKVWKFRCWMKLNDEVAIEIPFYLVLTSGFETTLIKNNRKSWMFNPVFF